MSGKVAEIKFFRFSKAAIFRQTKGQNHQTSGSLKKDAYIVAPNNSIFFEILMVDFELFRDSAGQKYQNLRIIPGEPRNLRKIPGN